MDSSSSPHRWVASWIATALTFGQLILLFVLGSGDIAWLRYAGFALWLVSAVFGWLPIIQFKRQGGVAKGDSYMKTTRLVDTGLYGIVRHPQFIAWPILAVAVSLVSQHPVVIVMGAGVIAMSALDFRAVDRLDIEKFGDEYREYMDRVPGWNPVAGLWRWVRRQAHTDHARPGHGHEGRRRRLR